MENPAADLTGMNIAANIFVIKLGVAIGGALTGWGLAWFGYQAGMEQQSAEAVRGVLILFTVLPVIFYLITAFSIRYYKLTEERMNHIVSDLGDGKFQTPDLPDTKYTGTQLRCSSRLLTA